MMTRRMFTMLAGASPLVLLMPTSAQAADLSGSWQGRWGSSNTRHNGMLRGTFTRLSATQYQVNFRGRFFKIFPFKYSVVLNVVSDNGYTTRMQGSSYLGRMFGTFYYTATVQAGQFNATYISCKDSGWFRLTKCGC